jgi:hypothetical protein
MRVVTGGRGLEVTEAPRTCGLAVVVRPEDPLDLAEAERLVDALEGLPAGVSVRVDFSALREVHATGLAALARALARGGRVTVSGLRRHDERLLAYLWGSPPEPPPGPRRPGAAARAPLALAA